MEFMELERPMGTAAPKKKADDAHQGVDSGRGVQHRRCHVRDVGRASANDSGRRDRGEHDVERRAGAVRRQLRCNGAERRGADD